MDAPTPLHPTRCSQLIIGFTARMINGLLSRERLGRWIEQHTPVGRPDLVSQLALRSLGIRLCREQPQAVTARLGER
jgi:hypothetical protein